MIIFMAIDYDLTMIFDLKTAHIADAMRRAT